MIVWINAAIFCDIFSSSVTDLSQAKTFQVECRLICKPEMKKPGHTENRKCGNPDHPKIGKSEISQKPKPSIFPNVNVFRLFGSKKGTGRGN